MFGANVEYRIQNTANVLGEWVERGEGYGKCMFVHAYVWHTRFGGARFIVFICSWPTETTPRLSSLRDCCRCPTVPRGRGRERGTSVVLFECRPKTILYHVEDSTDDVAVVVATDCCCCWCNL